MCEDRRQEAIWLQSGGGEEQTGKKRAKEGGGDWVPRVSEDMVRRLHLISRALENPRRFSVWKQRDRI